MSLGYLLTRLATSGGGESISGLEYLLTGLVALGIAIYLVIALLYPDRF
ncbi:MAG: potassium-transporting ATPase subunit F [Ktedonobacterales bacterium]